jgi:deoxyribodipyrimidine photo-lyase
LVWFRRDLRLHDNDAVTRAAEQSRPVVPVYVRDGAATRPLGRAAQTWRDTSLSALADQLHDRGSRLTVADGEAAEVLARLCTECDASEVIAQRSWTPEGVTVQEAVERALRTTGSRLTLVDDAYLVPPDALITKNGGPYRVFSAFYRQWRERISPAQPLEAPDRLVAPAEWPVGSTASEPTGAPVQMQRVGEQAALERLNEFVVSALEAYDSDRDLPAVDGTTRLSPHIAW